MIKRLLPLLLLFVTISACKKDSEQNNFKDNSTQTQTDTANDIAKLYELLKKYEEPSQIITVTSSKPSKAKGKHGTVLAVNPADLVAEDGKPLGKNITIELKELLDQKHLFNNRAQTVSDGRLLISGGAYYINMTSDNRQLKLKEGKTLSVEFPRISNEKMELFYGERDSIGRMNWIEADESFKKNKPQADIEQYEGAKQIDTLTGRTSDFDDMMAYLEQEESPGDKKQRLKKEKLQNDNYDKLYQAMQLKEFGWINCDRFPQIQNPTNTSFAITDKEKYDFVNIYLIFREINSVMDVYYSAYTKNNPVAKNIPIGSRVEVVAFSFKDAQIYSFKKDITIKQAEMVTIDLKETPEKDIAKIIAL